MVIRTARYQINGPLTVGMFGPMTPDVTCASKKDNSKSEIHPQS